MYIIDNILYILKEKGLKQVDMCTYININTSTMTNWKNRKTDPPAKYIIPICEFLNVSPYLLLTGKEKDLDLSTNEQKLLTYFKNLSDIDKGIVLGRAEQLAEQAKQNSNASKTTIKQSSNTDKTQDSAVQTAYMVARSYDNEPSKVVTRDFSDILNAPDATDEY